MANLVVSRKEFSVAYKLIFNNVSWQHASTLLIYTGHGFNNFIDWSMKRVNSKPKTW